MVNKIDKNQERQKRHMRVRNKIVGTNQKPRLNVYRSLTNIYAQIIDDSNGTTLVSASSLEKEIVAKSKNIDKSAVAKLVGELLAKRAMEKKIEEVVFDRGGYLYIGRVQSLADGARSAGLKF